MELKDILKHMTIAEIVAIFAHITTVYERMIEANELPENIADYDKAIDEIVKYLHDMRSPVE